MNEDIFISHSEAVDDFAPHIRPRSGCEREYRRMPEILDNVLEIQIIGPKIVAPFADAVGFVDDK